MADAKKITQLNNAGQLADEDVFVVVDKSTKSGPDASSSGKTAAVSFGDLKDQIGSQGEKGQRGEQGDKGNPGADSNVAGPRGLKGEPSNVPGPRGADSTVAGPRGSKGEPSQVKGPKGDRSTVKGPKGASSSVKGPRGSKGDKSTVKGPQGASSTVAGPKGKQGVPGNSNAHLGLRGQNCAISYGGHHIYKVKGGSAWDAQVYSSQSYTGGCQVSFRPATTSVIMMIGLNKDNPAVSTGFTSLDYAFYIHRDNRSISIREGGIHKKNTGNFSTSTILSIKYDGKYVCYYVDGNEVHKTTADSNMRFYMDSSIYYPTSSSQPVTSLLSFVPLQVGADGAKGEKSTVKGPEGAKGDKSTVKGPKGEPSTVKGPQGNASTVAGPRGPQGPAGEDSLINHADSSDWTIGKVSPISTAVVNPKGDFRTWTNKSVATESEVRWDWGPMMGREKVWECFSDDVNMGSTDKDGGYIKDCPNLDKNKSYMSAVYIKRTSADGINGTFQFGCGTGTNQTLATVSGGSRVNSTSHSLFFNVGLNELPKDVWCLALGFIKGNQDMHDDSKLSWGGLWRMDTGLKIVNNVGEYVMGTAGTNAQRVTMERCDINAKVQLCRPSFYEINAETPDLTALMGGKNTDTRHFTDASVVVNADKIKEGKTGEISCDANGFMRVNGKGAGVGIMQGSTEVARFSDTEIQFNKSVRFTDGRLNHGYVQVAKIMFNFQYQHSKQTSYWINWKTGEMNSPGHKRYISYVNVFDPGKPHVEQDGDIMLVSMHGHGVNDYQDGFTQYSGKFPNSQWVAVYPGRRSNSYAYHFLRENDRFYAGGAHGKGGQVVIDILRPLA